MVTLIIADIFLVLHTVILQSKYYKVALYKQNFAMLT